MRKRTKKVAVFDIDGTIFRSSLLIELFRELVENRIFPPRSQRVYLEEFRRWLERYGSYEDYIGKVVESYRMHIKEAPLKEVMEISDRLILFHKNRVYTYTRDLVRKLSKTHFLLAISHSPYHVVEPFCRSWGFDKVYAQIYKVDESGRFTGAVEHEDIIAHKDKVLERAVEKERLTLKGSVGVGDTESDIAFLKMVEQPLAFNPNRGLWEVARRKKWKVVVERKDMIYTIQKSPFKKRGGG